MTPADPNTPRVVILNDSSVAKGGATGLATSLARELASRGVDTTFVAGDAGDDGALAASGVTLQALGGKLLLDKGKLQAMRDGIYNRSVGDRIRKDILSQDTPHTVYHVHGWSRILSPAVFDALRPVAKRTFVHAHDFFLACPNGAFFDFRKEQVCDRKPLSASCIGTACDRRAYHHKLWRVGRQAMLRCTFDAAAPWANVLLLHQKMQPALERAGIPSSQMETLRNPAHPLSSDRIKAEDNETFVFLGRVEAGKGINLLCQAAKIAKVPLCVIGDGDELENLRKAYPEVCFTGWVAQSQICEHIRNARALVMPSRTPEPFGLVAAEASLSGLPVILSEQSLLAADFEQNKLGFKTSTRSAVDLAKVLADVRDLPNDVIADMSQRGFAGRSGIALSPEAWVDHLIARYRSVICDA